MEAKILILSAQADNCGIWH